MKLNFPDKLLPTFFARANQKNTGVEEYISNLYLQLANKIKANPTFKVTLENKVELSKFIIKKGIEKFGNKTVIAWTGGKDSTLILWFALQVCKQSKLKMPPVMFINEGHIFEEVEEFVKEITKKWKLNVTHVQNIDVIKQTKKVGDVVTVSKLDSYNQKEIDRLGYKEKTFLFEPESYVGNHLMKTVAMNRYLLESGYKGVVTGIRWDEQKARAEESYFSSRGDQFTPLHTRVHPILHFTEKEIWDAILTYKVPFCKLYKEGYRSLGAKGTTHKSGNKPAWEQDFEKVSERSGRRQDKEGIMENLRKLGYM
jgi:phosphoadenosine phosphosulfate reductase